MYMDNDELNEFTDRTEAARNAGVEEWLDEHGHPDFEYLESLVEEDTDEALKALRAIAEDLDVEYNEHATASELLEKIRLATQQNDDPEFIVP